MLHNIAYVSTLYFRLRRNYLIAWIVSLLVLTATFPVSFESYYPDLDTRTVVVHTMQSTMSTRAMYGMLENPGTIGQMVAWNGGAWITVLSSVMAILLFNSLYRIPEESGHSELIRSVGVSHTVMSVATVVVSLVTSVVIGAGTFVVLWVEMLIPGSFILWNCHLIDVHWQHVNCCDYFGTASIGVICQSHWSVVHCGRFYHASHRRY